jgi:hypothetical protein
MSEESKSNDARFDYIAGRIEAAFPKMKGAKLDKLLLTPENMEIVKDFCENPELRCLAVPDTIKLDPIIPSKIGKAKVLLLIRLTPTVLTIANMATDVSSCALDAKRYYFLIY